MTKLHPIAARLLADIEAYRQRVGIDRTAFGVQAAGVHPHQPPSPLLCDHAWRDREKSGGEVSEGVRDGPPDRAPETDEHREELSGP